jgi:hypothetical protein
MASKSKITHLAGQVDTKIDAILTRANCAVPGSPASDRFVELLRDLSAALDTFGTRSVDVYNTVATGQGTE